MMMMLMSLIGSGAMASQGGKEGEFKSSFNEGQLGGFNDIIQQIKGMGGQDITQNQNYQGGQNWLNNLFNDPEFFKSFEAPLQRQFQEQTVPELANRFAGQGSGGSLGSTAFRNQLAREGSNLSTNIGALRGGMQQQGVNQSLGYAQQPFSNLMSLYNQALGQGTNNVYQPPSAGPWGNIFAGLSSGMGEGLGQGFGQSLGKTMGGP